MTRRAHSLISGKSCGWEQRHSRSGACRCHAAVGDGGFVFAL